MVGYPGPKSIPERVKFLFASFKKLLINQLRNSFGEGKHLRSSGQCTVLKNPYHSGRVNWPPVRGKGEAHCIQTLYSAAFAPVQIPSLQNGHLFGIPYPNNEFMMNQYEVPVYISCKLPQIKNDLTRSGQKGNIHQSIRVVADYTKRMALEHDFKMVEKCMRLVERIYDKGDACVKCAVENTFIYSFSSMLSIYNIVEWRMLQSYMPSGLYALYLRQVLKPGN